MLNNLKFKIVIPERKVNISTSKKLLNYIHTASPLSESIIFEETITDKKFLHQMIIQFGPVVVPIKIIERDLYYHFDTVVTNLPETPATVLQTHMWNKNVTTALVYPFPIKQEDDTIAFTVSGSLPKSKLQKSFIDGFLVEFVDTCVFVMGSYYELGPEGPNNRSSQPSWVAKLAKKELEGPRASEFKLDNKSDDSENPDQETKSDNPDQ